jgi:hypothetical protein
LAALDSKQCPKGGKLGGGGNEHFKFKKIYIFFFSAQQTKLFIQMKGNAVNNCDIF